MSIREKMYQYRHQNVMHTTLNPKGPGVVRIHMVPPKFSIIKSAPSIVILNGNDIIPVNPSWAILLGNFIKHVNMIDEFEITDVQMQKAINGAIYETKETYPKADYITLSNDLDRITNALCEIASGKKPSENIGYMSLGKYAPFMTAPHRMDLLVSSMKKNDRWNCNQKCLHCYATGQNQAEAKELSTDGWKMIIDNCRKARIPQITFTGGEPTQRNDLIELIQYASWFVTRLNTNGIRLTEQYCKELYEASLDSIQITLYSSDEKIHNSLVGVNGFSHTTKGIKNALSAGLSVSINTPLCSINRDYISTLNYLHKLGVQYVTCSGIIITGNALKKESEDTQLSENELFEILSEATNYCASHEMEIAFTSPGWVEPEKIERLGLIVPSCGASLSNMAIAPNGEVVPCQSWLNSDYTLGNMIIDSWQDIWNNPTCKKIRNFSSIMSGTCPLKDKMSFIN